MAIDLEAMEIENIEIIEDMEVLGHTITLDALLYLYDNSSIETKYSITLVDKNTIEVTYDFKNSEYIGTTTYKSIYLEQIELKLINYSGYFYDLESAIDFFKQETYTMDESNNEDI